MDFSLIIPRLRDNPFLALFFGDNPVNDNENNTPEESAVTTLGAWNLKVGRNPELVLREVIELLKRFELEVLCVVEAKMYYRYLRQIQGFEYICDPASDVSRNSGILVRKNIPHGPGGQMRLTYKKWRRWHGEGYQNGRIATRVTVRDIPIIATHFPPGGPSQPIPEQQNAFRDCAANLAEYGRTHDGFVFIGDMNTPASNKEPYSLGWAATQAGLDITGTGIDYAVSKGVKVYDMEHVKYGGSDHDPIICKIRKAK